MARKAVSSLRTSKKSRSKAWRVIGVVLVVVGVVFILFVSHVINLTTKKSPGQTIVQAGRKSPAAVNNSSSGSAPAKTLTSNNTTNNNGGVTSTNGTPSSSTPPSQWSTSQSGQITVKQPYANETIQSGAVLSGTALVSQVYFTLIDNQVGVVDQGTLNVVNHAFSGTLNFTPHASSGRLDVYSTNTPGGAEMNLIEIGVNF